MSTTRVTWDDQAVASPVADGTRFGALGGIGFLGAGPGTTAVVGQDASGHYAAQGFPVYALGDLLPTGAVMRLTLRLELVRAQGRARVIAPLRLQHAHYVVFEMRRTAADRAQLSAYITDEWLSLNFWIAAYEDLGPMAAFSGLFTVEVGPRYGRAWWDGGAGSWRRRSPDLGVYLGDMQAETWGFMCGGDSSASAGTDYAKVRWIDIDTAPQEPTESDYRASVQTDDVDALVASAGGTDPTHLEDTSTATLLTYRPSPHELRRRSVVAIHSSQVADGWVPEHQSRRLDPYQTIILSPQDDQVVSASSHLGWLSGPGGATLSVAAPLPPSGDDGGIGSAREAVDILGEPCLDLPEAHQDAQMIHSLNDSLTESGGEAAHLLITTHDSREWDLMHKLHPEHLRRAERLLQYTGSSRPLWILPPMEPRAVCAIMGPIEHGLNGPERAELRYRAAETF